jgi:hypothetical protein
MEVKATRALSFGHGNKFQALGFESRGGNVIETPGCVLKFNNSVCKREGDKPHPLDSHPSDKTVKVDKERLGLFGIGRQVNIGFRW